MANLGDRYLGINKEASYGTTLVTGLEYGEVDDESFAQSLEILTREDISRYAARRTVIGSKYSSGDVSWAMLGDLFTGRIIANAWGKCTQSGSGTARTNTLEEIKVDTVTATSGAVTTGFNSLTIEVGRDGRAHRYPGQVLDSLTIGANINEYVMMSASFVGCGEDNSAEHALTAALTDANVHANDAFHFNGAHVAFEGVGTATAERSPYVKSIELNINLNRDTDSAMALGSATYTRAPLCGIREIKGTIEFNRAMNDAENAKLEPFFKELSEGLMVNGNNTDPAISLYFTGGTNESLLIDIFKVQYDPPDSTISGRDIQTLKCSFTALYDEGQEAMSKAVWKTTQTTNVLT